MKSPIYALFSIIILTLLTGCEVIKGIFKAGVWSGILMVALVIALIIFLLRMFMGRK